MWYLQQGGHDSQVLLLQHLHYSFLRGAWRGGQSQVIIITDGDHNEQALQYEHKSQNCKVCHVMFKHSMEVLQHAAKEHSQNIIANTSVKEKEQQIAQHEEDISEYENKIDL